MQYVNKIAIAVAITFLMIPLSSRLDAAPVAPGSTVVADPFAEIAHHRPAPDDEKAKPRRPRETKNIGRRGRPRKSQ